MEKILKKLKKLLRLIFGRTTLGTLFLLIQILVLFAGFDWFREYLIYMYGGSAMLSALVLIYIISDEGNSTIKLSWVVPILIFPVFGTLFYLFLTLQPGTRRINRRIEEVGTKLRPYLLQDPEVLAHYESISASGGNLVRYMNQYGRFPAYAWKSGLCMTAWEISSRCRTAMRKRCRRKVSSARFLRRCVRLSRVTRITAITGKSV